MTLMLLVAGFAHAVGDRQHQHGDREGEQDADQSGELDVVGMPLDVHEPLQFM